MVGTDINLYDAIDFAAQRAQQAGPVHDDLDLSVLHSLSSVTGPGAIPLQVSTETYGRAAEVEVTGDIHCVMPYIPSHLDYMLYELLKNAHRCKCVGSSCRPLNLC